MKLIDFILAPPLYVLALFIAYFISRKLGRFDKMVFMVGYLSKIVGGLGLGMVYAYYYGKGDTFGYFNSGLALNSSLSDSLNTWISLMWSSDETPEKFEYLAKMSRYRYSQEYFMVRISALFGLISFNSYLANVFWFSTYSFLGSWYFYKALVRRYPNLAFYLGFSIFFVPSVIFWGSGLLKDSIVLGSLGFLVYGFDLISKDERVKGLFVCIASAWMITSVRDFMLPLLMAPLVMTLFIRYTLMIEKQVLRLFASITGILISIPIAAIYLNNFLNELANFAEEAKISALYLYRVSVDSGGSAYFLGELDGSINSVLRLLPKGIVVSLFRPYPWEATNIMMLLTSLESTLILLLSAYLIIRNRIFGVLTIISNDSFLQYAIFFSLLFAFIVGITTYNFGSLARYRLPILPFYISSLVIIAHNKKIKKT